MAAAGEATAGIMDKLHVSNPTEPRYAELGVAGLIEGKSRTILSGAVE